MATEEELEQGKMPLLDHLIELRRRIMWSAVALIVAFIPCFYFAQPIYDFLAAPLAVLLKGQPFIQTDILEGFVTNIRVAFWASFCLAFPVIASRSGCSSLRVSTKTRKAPSCRTCSQPPCSSSRARRSPIS
jgi:sec-independent protein translocase protein TatC